MELTNEQIEKIYQSFDCLIPKSLIKKVLQKVLAEFLSENYSDKLIK